jgi:glucosyl-3-phosphoglycerate synthase
MLAAGRDLVRRDVRDWFERRTWSAHDWPLPALLAAKGATTVAVVLPALDEQATVGRIVTSLRGALVDVPRPLVDEVVVVDSGSVDRTGEVAAAAGARVVHVDDVVPGVPRVPGKGEALWRSLAATSADVIVFVDADLLSFQPSYVTGLLGPLLTDPDISFVKAMYDRPLIVGDDEHPSGGGRVTELVARPLLNLHWPQLAGFVQPLAGEYAARRALLERLPFATGYGVELAMLIDAERVAGLDAMAQVDLGHRRHRHHDSQHLGRMAAEVWQAALARLRLDGEGASFEATMTQFDRDGARYRPRTHDVTALERPPMARVLREQGLRR